MMFGLMMMAIQRVHLTINKNMNEEMLKDQIAQLQTDLEIMRKKKEYYEQFYSPCLGIYYGRIAMSEEAILDNIKKIENLLREPNIN